MRIITYFLVLVVMLFGVTFAGLNATPVKINYYLGSTEMALSLLLAMSLVLGSIIGLLIGLMVCLKVKTENLRYRHRLKLAEQEVQNLRAIPIKDSH